MEIRPSGPTLSREIPLRRPLAAPASAPAPEPAESLSLTGDAPSGPASDPTEALLHPNTAPWSAEVREALGRVPAEVRSLVARAGYQVAFVDRRPEAPLPFRVKDFPLAFVQERARRPLTFEDAARAHGARTPDEIGGFCDLMAQANPDLPVDFSHPPASAIPAGQPFLAPAYHHLKGQKVPCGDTRMPYDVFTRGDVSGRVSPGQQVRYTDAPERTILVWDPEAARENGLLDWHTLHEFGHAVWLSVEEAAPAFGARADARLQQIFQGSADRLTTYGATKPDELFAEAFAAAHARPGPRGPLSDPTPRVREKLADTLRRQMPYDFDLIARSPDFAAKLDGLVGSNLRRLGEMYSLDEAALARRNPEIQGLVQDVLARARELGRTS